MPAWFGAESWQPVDAKPVKLLLGDSRGKPLNAQNPQASSSSGKGFSGLQVFGVVLVTMLVTVVAGWWLVGTYLFPSELRPVELSREELIQLDRKLEMLGVYSRPVDGAQQDDRIVPEAYSEEGAPRFIEISERELNSLFARDPQLGSRMAVDLSPDLVSVTALLPVPEDSPLMPGQNLRVRAGAEFSFAGGRPVLKLKGVTVMGVPLPNAWLGNMKNIDLIAEGGTEGEFWQAFANGVAGVEVAEGRLRVDLKE